MFRNFRIRVLQGFANTSFAVLLLFRKIRKVFDSILFLLQNPVLYVIHKESVLGRLHCVRRVIREQSPLESPALCCTLNSGEARRAALVARFAAGHALAIRSRRLPNKPPPCASQRLLRGAPPPSRRPVNVGSVRHLQKGTTPVLSVIRRRALASVADCGISMWLP